MFTLKFRFESFFLLRLNGFEGQLLLLVDLDSGNLVHAVYVTGMVFGQFSFMSFHVGFLLKSSFLTHLLGNLRMELGQLGFQLVNSVKFSIKNAGVGLLNSSEVLIRKVYVFFSLVFDS